MNLKYLAIGGASVSAIGGVCYASFTFMKPKNLREDLIKNNYKPLSLEQGKDKETWTKLLAEYEKVQDLRINSLSFDGASDTDAKIAKLQGACKALYETKKDTANYSTLFNTAKAWCISNSEKLTNSTTVTASTGRSEGTGVASGSSVSTVVNNSH